MFKYTGIIFRKDFYKAWATPLYFFLILFCIALSFSAFIISLVSVKYYAVGFMNPQRAGMYFNNAAGMASMVCLVPLIASIPGARLFYEDKTNNSHSILIPRTGARNYYTAKYFESWFYGFLLSFLPGILNYLLCLICFQQSEIPLPVSGSIYDGLIEVESLSTLFPDLYFHYPFMDTLVHLLLISMLCAGLGMISYTISLYYTKHHILIWVLPTLCWIAANMILSVLKQYNWTLLELLRTKPIVNGADILPVIIWLIIIYSISLIMLIVKLQSKSGKDEL